MPLSTQDRLSLTVQCDNPKCGKDIDKPLTWLFNKSRMVCPSCGCFIVFHRGANGFRIKELVERVCALTLRSVRAANSAVNPPAKEEAGMIERVKAPLPARGMAERKARAGRRKAPAKRRALSILLR